MRRFALILIPLLSFPLSGCLAVAAAAVVGGTVGYIKYDKNEASRDFEKDFDRTWKATQKTIAELGFNEATVKTDTPTEVEAEGEDIWVKVEARVDGFTRVRVRVGTFDTEDNKRRSALILETVADKLGLK